MFVVDVVDKGGILVTVGVDVVDDEEEDDEDDEIEAEFGLKWL